MSAIGILIDDFATGRNVTVLPPSVSTLTWDTKVKLLLPEDWKLHQEWATEKANLRDIFTHVSGLTRFDLYMRLNRNIAEESFADMIRPTIEMIGLSTSFGGYDT